MKKYLLLFSLLVSLVAYSQTTLEKGDVMVLGVNVNNNPCDDTSTDLFHLVFLTEIETDTEILITDNPWFGGNPPFQRNEGVILLKRIGGNLAPGAIVPIKMTDLGSGGQNNQPTGNGISPGWTITKIHNNSGTNNAFALTNTGGDQLFIWQGTWNSINPGNFTGELLFAYNTKNRWLNTSDSNNSLLPPELYCYHATPFVANPNTDQNFPFRHYNGPTTLASRGEWKIRVLNAGLWSSNLSNCGNYNTGFSNAFPTNQINIKETEELIEVCQGDIIPTLSVGFYSSVNYQWFISPSDDITIGDEILGATFNTYTPTQSGFYYCEMTINIPVNIQGTIMNNECSFFSNVFQVTVHPGPATSPVIPL